LVLGLAFVGIGIGGVLNTYATDLSNAVRSYPGLSARYEQLQCVRELTLTKVAKDSTILVSEPDLYWLSRLKEISAPERLFTEDPGQADVVVSMTFAPDAPCDGVGITVLSR